MRYLIPCCLLTTLLIASCGESGESAPVKVDAADQKTETKTETIMKEETTPVAVEGQTYSLEIDGMFCQNCARHVTDALSGLDGVLSAEVDHSTGRATVTMVKGKKLDEAKARDLLDIDNYDLKICTEIQ